MSTLTFADVLGAHDVAVPDDTIAELEVPVLTGPQRQGDVGIFPGGCYPERARSDRHLVPAAGVPVVRGEATGNTHLLHAAGPVFWCPSGDQFDGVDLGLLAVPDGSTAYLIHTDEHGANGIGPGTYRLAGKREQAEQIRRVAD